MVLSLDPLPGAGETPSVPDDVALIDLGSNAVRCVLARITPGVGYRVLREARTQTRLGGGRSGKLPGPAIRETVASVERFLAGLDGARPPRVLAIATAAVRDAENRERLLGALARRAGVTVRILSPAEEAELGVVAAFQSLPARDGVVIDLGGGSLQLSPVRGGRSTGPASLPLGAVRLTRRFLRSDPPLAREGQALRAEVRQALDAVLPVSRPGDALVGLGGTIRTLARIHREAHAGRERRHGLRLRLADVTTLRERLEALPLRRRRRVPGLKAERADIILAGVLVVEELMRRGGYRVLTVCTLGVRDGVLWREAHPGNASAPTGARQRSVR